MLSKFHLRLKSSISLIALISMASACSSNEPNSVQMINSSGSTGGVYAQLVDGTNSISLLVFNEGPEAITVDSAFGDQSMRSDSKLDTEIVTAHAAHIKGTNQSTMPPSVLRRSYPLIVLGPGRVIGMTMQKVEILDAVGANACSEVGFQTSYQVKEVIKKVRSNLLTICRI